MGREFRSPATVFVRSCRLVRARKRNGQPLAGRGGSAEQDRLVALNYGLVAELRIDRWGGNRAGREQRADQ
jgi:hypothetical protein